MQKRPRLYYDTECKICTVFAETVESSATAPLIIPAQANTESAPADTATLLMDIHLVDSDGTVRTGADAVLTTLSYNHTWLTPVTKLFRLPLFKTIAHIGYRLVSKRRKLLFGNEYSRTYWLFLLTNLGLLAGILLTLPTWIGDRTYPTSPLVPIFAGSELITSLASLILILTLTTALFATKQFHRYTLTAASVLFFLVLCDITRLQPWVLHYGAMLALLSTWRVHLPTSSARILNSALFILVGIYLWSGLQKMNTAFFLETFPWFTEPLWSNFGEAGAYAMLAFGVFVPFIEAGFALGLLTKSFRRLSLLLIAAMHTLVISAVMFGHGWNSSVWPWNIIMLTTAIVLFAGNRATFSSLLQQAKHNLLALVTISVFIIMPLGNIFGQVDHYLAWSLYSGHVPTAHLTAPVELVTILAPQVSYIPSEDNTGTIPFVRYAESTLNVVPYPEERVFLSIFGTLCERYQNDAASMLLTVETRPFFTSHLITTHSYTCP